MSKRRSNTTILIEDLLNPKIITLDKNIHLAIGNDKIIPDLHPNADGTNESYNRFIDELNEKKIEYYYTTTIDTIWPSIWDLDNCKAPASFFCEYIEERNKRTKDNIF